MDDLATADDQKPDPDANRRRSKVLPAVRVSIREDQTIRGNAKSSGMQLSDFIRSRCMLAGGDVVTDTPPSRKSPRVQQRDDMINAMLSLTNELNRIGVNLNQAVRRANVHGEVDDRISRMLETDAEQIAEVIAAVNELVPKIR